MQHFTPPAPVIAYRDTPEGQREQAAAIWAHIAHADRRSAALKRTIRIMRRCYPDPPVGNPFINHGDRVWFMSRQRGDFHQFKERRHREIEARLLAKIESRESAHAEAWGMGA